MDIIDIMLARALTPQGQIESYAAQSQQAIARANQAVSNIETITEQTNTNNTTAQQTLADAQTALSNAAAAESRIETALETIQGATTEQINNQIDDIDFQLNKSTTNTVVTDNLVITTPSGASTTVNNINKLYRSTGSNEDGTMTQKAITDALSEKANTADTVTKTYVDRAIANASIGGGGSGGISNLGIDANGHIVVVGPDGNITAGDTTEAAIIEALVKAGTYSAEDTVGLIIDYENKSCERSQDAVNLRAGTSFNKYSMYGGRIRCNVADNGTINAFYGDAGYKEDGSNGQVMIYQPKFYYQRIILKSENTGRGTVVRKESIIISPETKTGFKLHPLFILGDEELDYVLLPAYEGSIYDVSTGTYFTNNNSGVSVSEDKVCSIANVKPFNGINNTLKLADVKALARNRGEGWQLTNAEFESANQMLEMIEFGTMNIQSALEKGVVSVARDNAKDCSAITGSTSSLGNTTGAAASTVVDRDGTTTAYTTAGSRAVSYRGMENPWGNVWRLVDNLTAHGGGASGGGYIVVNGETTPIQLPTSSNAWISAMGYGNDKYDWLYIPAECASTANSAVPVGDSLWSMTNLNGTNLIGVGGLNNSDTSAGIFHYSADIGVNANLQYFNGRIMFIPEKNSIYNSNITKWQQHYGG